jgi:hypothetical protein
MYSFLVLIQLLFPLLTTTNAQPSPIQGQDSLSKRSQNIQWGPCDPILESQRSLDLPIDCANLKVPLDYTDANSTATITLELVRVRAARAPSQGSILFNYGGPGEVGRANLLKTMHLYVP